MVTWVRTQGKEILVNIYCILRSVLPSSCWRMWFSSWLTSSTAVSRSLTWRWPKPTERDRNWWGNRTSSNRSDPKNTQRFSKKCSVRSSWPQTNWRLVCDVIFRSLASWRLPSRTAVEGRVLCCVWRSWRTRRILRTSTCSDSATESSDTPRRTTARTRWGGRWRWR